MPSHRRSRSIGYSVARHTPDRFRRDFPQFVCRKAPDATNEPSTARRKGRTIPARRVNGTPIVAGVATNGHTHTERGRRDGQECSSDGLPKEPVPPLPRIADSPPAAWRTGKIPRSPIAGRTRTGASPAGRTPPPDSRSRSRSAARWHELSPRPQCSAAPSPCLTGLR